MTLISHLPLSDNLTRYFASFMMDAIGCSPRPLAELSSSDISGQSPSPVNALGAVLRLVSVGTFRK